MKKGYYLWDWYGTNTIMFDSDIQFDCDERAKAQGCYRRFKDAKEAGGNQACAHQFHYFGSQPKRRCNLCNAIEQGAQEGGV